MLRRVPSHLLAPATLMALTAVALYLPRIAAGWVAAHDVLLGAVLASAILPALQFNRGRVALAAAAIGAADATLVWTPWGAEPAARLALAACLPPALLALALLPERRLVAAPTRLLVAAAPALVALVATAQPDGAPGEITPAAALASTAVAGLVMAARFVARPSPLDAGFLGALAACAVAFAPSTPAGLASPWLTAATFTLAYAVLQEGRRMAYHDELTGLLARRSFAEHLAALDRPYAIAMLDVDHFKRFNDTHGHETGDRVLRLVASRLEEVGGGGRAYRCGGEEFAVVFDGATADDARPHVEALRAAIERSRLELPRRGVARVSPYLRLGLAEPDGWAQVTVSAGLAEPTAALRTPEAVLAAADAALYAAKKQGRNRVCTAPSTERGRRPGGLPAIVR